MNKWFPKFNLRRHKYHHNSYKKIIGIILGIVGSIIVIQVVPLTFWFFLLGLLLIALGISLIKMF